MNRALRKIALIVIKNPLKKHRMSFAGKTSIMFSSNNKPQNQIGNNSQQLLAAKTPLQIPIRTTMGDAKSPSISLANPLADYKTLMDNMMNSNLDDEEQMQTYKAIAAEARKAVWNLLFVEPSVENEKKAAELLKEHKMDACFYVPWDYNDWIVDVRDEVLKREMLDFWRNVFVKESLGPCWARDSDYFDDMDDPEPAQFYRHAGAIAPWESERKETTNSESQENGDGSELPPVVVESSVASPRRGIPTADELKISQENPLDDYRKIVERYLSQNTTSNDEEAEEIYKLIAESARNCVWSLLFDDPQPPTEERQKKAGDLLKEHKMDACFYSPWVYNEWVVKLRDEVLKRELLEFWREQMVKNSLGLCWAKDSDYYDDMEDRRPVEFYNHAGCVAPWLKEQTQNEANETKSSQAFM